MPFEELEHTADVLMRVSADTLEELFAEAARALSFVMFGAVEGGACERQFSIESDDATMLLHEFLSELLFLADVGMIAISGAEVRLDGNRLDAVIKGEPFDPARHGGGTEVKGISFSGLRIIKEREGYVVDILFDV